MEKIQQTNFGTDVEAAEVPVSKQLGTLALGTVAVALAAGVVSVIRGLVVNHDPLASVWSVESIKSIAFFASAIVVLVIAGARRGISARWMLLMTGLVLSISASGLSAVASSIAIVASATHLGFLLVARYRSVAGDDLLLMGVAAAVGLSIFVGVLQLVSRFQVHYPIVYLCLLMAPFAFRPASVTGAWAGLLALASARQKVQRDWKLLLFWSLALLCVLARLLGVFMPEIGADALSMHLVMPAIVAREHVWMPSQSGFLWAWIPLAGDWIYVLSYVLGGEQAARLLNFASDLLVMVLCAGVARRIAGSMAAAVAAVLYSCAPLAYFLTTSLFVENLWTLWVAAALVMATAMRTRELSWQAWASFGLLLGAAMASKVITAFWVPVFLFFAIERLIAAPRRTLVMFGVFGGCFVAVAAWPYAAAWIETGNPVFPFMNSIFKSPLYSTTVSFDNALFRHPVNWRLLYDVTFSSNRYLEAVPGAFGLLWLAILPTGILTALIAGGRWLRALAIGSILFVILVFSFQSYLRYIAPVYPLWATTVGIGTAYFSRSWFRVPFAAVVLVGGIAGLILYANATWWYRSLPQTGPLEPRRYEEWAREQRPEAGLIAAANDMKLQHVLWLGRPTYAGLDARVSANNWHQPDNEAKLRTASNAAEIKQWVGKMDAVVVTPGFDPCNSPALCEVMEGLGDPAFSIGSAKMYLVPREWRFSQERLVDIELTGSRPGWVGAGAWNRSEGRVQVAGDRAFSQPVAVKPSARYLYTIRARCHNGAASFRMQVNWLDSTGRFIEPTIFVEPCRPEWRSYSTTMTAPLGAATAVVYATGHEPGRVVEVDSVSFRQ